MSSREDLLRAGEEVRRRLAGGGTFQPSQPTAYRLAPGLERLVTEALFGGVWPRPALDLTEHSLATLSALLALGRDPQMRVHFRNALNLGLTVPQLAEMCVHLVPYAGLPASLNALNVLGQVAQERPEWQAQIPPEDAPDPHAGESLEDLAREGQAVRETLWGPEGSAMRPVLAELAPWLGDLVRGYVFGAIYRRPGLTLRQRLICTLSALTVLGRLPQLRRYIQASLRNGLTKEQVVEVLAHTAFYGGIPATLNALETAREVFRETQG